MRYDLYIIKMCDLFSFVNKCELFPFVYKHEMTEISEFHSSKWTWQINFPYFRLGLITKCFSEIFSLLTWNNKV